MITARQARLENDRALAEAAAAVIHGLDSPWEDPHGDEDWKQHPEHWNQECVLRMCRAAMPDLFRGAGLDYLADRFESGAAHRWKADVNILDFGREEILGEVDHYLDALWSQCPALRMCSSAGTDLLDQRIAEALRSKYRLLPAKEGLTFRRADLFDMTVRLVHAVAAKRVHTAGPLLSSLAQWALPAAREILIQSWPLGEPPLAAVVAELPSAPADLWEQVGTGSIDTAENALLEATLLTWHAAANRDMHLWGRWAAADLFIPEPEPEALSPLVVLASDDGTELWSEPAIQRRSSEVLAKRLGMIEHFDDPWRMTWCLGIGEAFSLRCSCAAAVGQLELTVPRALLGDIYTFAAPDSPPHIALLWAEKRGGDGGAEHKAVWVRVSNDRELFIEAGLAEIEDGRLISARCSASTSLTGRAVALPMTRDEDLLWVMEGEVEPSQCCGDPLTVFDSDADRDATVHRPLIAREFERHHVISAEDLLAAYQKAGTYAGTSRVLEEHGYSISTTTISHYIREIHRQSPEWFTARCTLGLSGPGAPSPAKNRWGVKSRESVA